MSLRTWIAEETQLVDGKVYPRMTQVPKESFMYKQLNNMSLSYNRYATQMQ